jgi:hypothetical protein
VKVLTKEERLIRQYLLRELDDSGQRQLEERVFTDREYMEQVLMIEDELVEDFVFDELPASEKERFLVHFLSTPQQVQKLEITEALKEYVALAADTATPPGARVLAFLHRHKRLVQLTIAAALLLAVFCGAWLLKPDPLVLELARLNVQQTGSSAQNGTEDYSLTLTPVRTRGGAASPEAEPDVTVLPERHVVRLRLALMGGEYESYRVVMQRQTADAEPIIVDNLKPEVAAGGKVIPIRIPARLLTPGYYQLTLSGYANGKLDDDLDSYTFHIRAKS